MLLQGVLSCLKNDMQCTIAKLDSIEGATEFIFSEIFAQVGNDSIKEDFEVKIFMLGLATFIDPNVPASVQGQLTNIMKALTYLSSRSIAI